MNRNSERISTDRYGDRSPPMTTNSHLIKGRAWSPTAPIQKQDRLRRFFSFLLLFTCNLTCSAQRSSTNYSITAETLDGGGALATSVNYALQGSVETAASGISAVAPIYEIQHGYFEKGNLALSLYEQWAIAEGLDLNTNGQPDQNPDGDNLDNILEYAFGLDPEVNDHIALVLGVGPVLTTRGIPVVYSAVANSALDFRAAFLRRANYIPAGLTYTVQFSADMNNWYDAQTGIISNTLYSEVELVTVAYPLFLQTLSGIEKAKFFRIKVDFSG